MRQYAFFAILVVAAGLAADARGHGIRVTVTLDGMSKPVEMHAFSDVPFLDIAEFAEGPDNLFLGTFGTALSDNDGTPPDGTYYRTVEGFATAVLWPTPFTATYDIVSPLFYSTGAPTGVGGTAEALPAPDGTQLQTFDRFVGDGAHPGAESGAVIIDGTGVTSAESGYGVSMTDTHEMEKRLYIGSGPTNVAYGFAFTVTAHFPTLGVTLTSPRMVDIFLMPTFAADDSVDGILAQDAASLAVYNAAMAVPEPSSLVLLGCGAAGLALAAWRRRRTFGRR